MSPFNPIRPDRRSFIGGSDARTIMGDDEATLVRLWREKRGEVEPEDLSTNLVVQLGTVTEHLNRHWYERNTGQVVTEAQRQVFHPVKRWMAATLDGMVEGTGAVFEAKFMLPWSFSEEAEFAGVFCQTRAAYLDHDAAKAELKKLMPEDAKEAVGHGIRAKRSKSGAISFDLQMAEVGHAAI